MVRTAHDLFAARGFRAVGVDRIVAEARVAKTTLYRHFQSKDDLTIAALELRQQEWTQDWLVREIEQRGDTPVRRLLAIFDVFDEWFRGARFAGCLFVNTLLESRDRTSPVGAASVEGLAQVRSVVREQAEAAGVRDADRFAMRWQVLMWGSIIGAMTGDLEAAVQAREVALLLLADEGLEP